MDVIDLMRYGLAFLVVIGLMLALAWGLRRTGLSGPMTVGANRRLRVVEAMALGARHRLVLVRRDDCEHLLLLGPHGDVVVERDIDAGDRPPPSPAPATFQDWLGRMRRPPGETSS